MKYSSFVLHVPQLSIVTCVTWVLGGGQVSPIIEVTKPTNENVSIAV